MRNVIITLCLFLFAHSALADEDRRTWVTHCQKSSSELSGSIGWRICTGQYLDHLEKQQSSLISKLKPTLAAAQGEGVNVGTVERLIFASQRDWERFVKNHCEAAEAAFGIGNSSGDVMPSCLVIQYEIRNRQLQGVLDGDYER